MLITPTIRQLIVVGACQLAALSSGGAMGYPIVMLHQLRGEDSPIQLDLDSASWIGAMHGLAGITSVIIPSFMQWRGRKAAFLFGCIAVTLGWIIAYCANSIPIILTSEFIHGFGTNSIIVVAILTITEMTAPKYRNIYIQLFSIIKTFGMAVSGVLSAVLSSKNICIFMIIPILISIVLTAFWPESPSWLACKGRFDETYTAYMSLRNIDETSKKELEDLIAAQKENLSRRKRNELGLKLNWNKVKRRDFYIPVIHSFLILHLKYWSGTAVVVINSFEVIKKTTQSEDVAFIGSVVINGMLFLGILLSSIFNKKFLNKTILLFSVLCTVISLFGVFVITLLQSIDVLSKESMLSLYFLIAYVASDSFGIIAVGYTIVSEVMPVKHRGLGGAVYVILNSSLFSMSLKLSPYLFMWINIWGTFLLFMLNAIVCGFFVWKYIPETKNRTLQEIEDFYMFGEFIERQSQSQSRGEICASNIE